MPAFRLEPRLRHDHFARVEMDLPRRTAELFAQEQFAQAAELLSEALTERESAELWYDWAAVQISLGKRWTRS